MLTGRAAELRPDINYLASRPVRLDVPQTPRTAMPGDFAQGLKLGCLNASLRAKRERMSRDQAAAEIAAEQGRPWIPRSGPDRRRAKAIRNKDAVAAMAPTWADVTDSVTHPQTIVRGRQYETDLVPDDGLLGELRMLDS